MITVVWFRQDLRVADQPLLQRAASLSQPVLGLYLLPDHWLHADADGMDRLGPAKSAFLLESLNDLQAQLAQRGLTLQCLRAEPVTLLSHWHARQPLQVITAAAQAPEEAAMIAALRQAGIRVIEEETQTLLAAEAVPWQGAFPATFSRFRRKVESRHGVPVTSPQGPPPSLSAAQPLPAPPFAEPAREVLAQRCQFWRCNSQDYFSLSGGEQAGLQWLEHYLFETRSVDHYKQTRNRLIGAHFSSRLSAFLAWGNLSVRRVWQRILDYDAMHGSNPGSEWLRVELLWREFYHWSLREHGARVFHFAGLNDEGPRWPEPASLLAREYWQRWCQANTGLPFIDANLRELMATGYASNRGRQNLASFWVHDMGLDWRRGARWFQHHLVDDDVASNWGNWAYIAGVGHDARGGRRFSPTRQCQHYDPEGEHLHYWLPALRALSARQCLSLHFTFGQDDPLPDYPAAMLPLPAADLKLA